MCSILGSIVPHTVLLRECDLSPRPVYLPCGATCIEWLSYERHHLYVALMVASLSSCLIYELHFIRVMSACKIRVWPYGIHYYA